MNHTNIKHILCAALLFVVAAVCHPQNFKPFTRLEVIETEHFSFIFPHESLRTALSLSSRAEDIYDRISTLLGIQVPQKIPVSITPHTDMMNGYYQPFPYQHILVFDTPSGPEWTTFQNNVESLFLHELTHAVSMATAPALEKARRIFGGWVNLTQVQVPEFMVEGVTVSFESADGAGRANDPVIKERVRQDIIEGRFKMPFQASGAYDLPPAGNVFYEYGGLFSHYLIAGYGMEKYSALWRAMGEKYTFSFIYYKHGFFVRFREVYGKDIRDVWKEFQASLELDNIKHNDNAVVQNKHMLISDTAAADGKVYYIDTVARKVFSYDTAAGKRKAVMAVDSSAYALDVSPEGKCIIVSAYRTGGAQKGQLEKAIVTEYNTGTGLPTGRRWYGLYQARYFRDGVTGIAANLHNTNLVWRGGGDITGENERLLVAANDNMAFSKPAALDGSRIVFTAAKSGIRYLCVYDFDTGNIFDVTPEDDAPKDVFRYMRGLSVSDGKIVFEYNNDDRMYKLGVISINNEEGAFGQATLTDTDYSGGVFAPVIAGGDVFYRGAFSGRDALMRYPESADKLAGDRVMLKLVPWQAGALATSAVSQKEPLATESIPVKSYNVWKYMNPFNLWVPYPIIRPYSPSFITGPAIFSLMMDPADTNIIQLYLGADLYYMMADVTLAWTNYYFGFPLSISVSDTIVENVNSAPYRQTNAALSASLNIPLGTNHTMLTLTPSLQGVLQFSQPKDDMFSAYQWPLYGYGLYAGFGVRVSTLTVNTWEIFGQGLSAGAYIKHNLRPELPKVEGVLRGAMQTPWPLRLTLYGAWDKYGMNLAGTSTRYSSTAFSTSALSEYSKEGGYLTFLGGAEAETQLFSLEIQNGFSHLYFNRVFMSLAWRGALYDPAGIAGNMSLSGNAVGSLRMAQSLVLKLGTNITTTIVPPVPIGLPLSFWAAWKISALSDAKKDNFAFGFDFNFSY